MYNCIYLIICFFFLGDLIICYLKRNSKYISLTIWKIIMAKSKGLRVKRVNMYWQNHKQMNKCAHQLIAWMVETNPTLNLMFCTAIQWVMVKNRADAINKTCIRLDCCWVPINLSALPCPVWQAHLHTAIDFVGPWNYLDIFEYFLD